MKKLIIPAATLLLVACAQPFLGEKNNNNTPVVSTASSPPIRQENTRHPFAPSFTALNIPKEMKQNFRINPKTSQIVVGKSGTMVLVPDHAFADESGNPVSGKVKMEIIEGIKNADIIKMNLGTMSDQGPLETGGMVYINAFSENGDTLQLANGKQLDVEIPTDNKKRGMKLWTGISHQDGSVSWTNPKPLKENLRPVPANTLQEKTDKATKKVDAKSDVTLGNSFVIRLDAWEWREGDRFWHQASSQADTNAVPIYSANGDYKKTINLADKKFENTNIATAEFRSRLPFIRQACDSRILLCYTEHPNRALWKSDNDAADSLEKTACPLAELFHQFAKLKQGKVNLSDSNTVAALDAAREKAIKNYSHNVHEAQRKFDSLNPAFASYSFGMQTLGWANIDRLATGGASMFFNVHVDGVGQNETTQVVLLVPEKNLFINGYKRPNGDYSFTHGECELQASYPAGVEAYILGKSGNGEKFQFVLKKIILGQNEIEHIALHTGTQEELTHALGNDQVKKEEPEKDIDDWYTKALRTGGGCVCGSDLRMSK